MHITLSVSNSLKIIPAILYNNSLSLKESSLRDVSQILDDKSELSLPKTDCCMFMSENKIFSKRFLKRKNLIY